MRKGGGKAKGASFEREICCRLSLWLSDGQQEDLLWRSAMSGGRSTVGHKKGKRLAAQAGDISAIHPLGATLTDKYMVECKAYKDLNYAGLLTNKGVLIDFWKEACLQASRYGKSPILISKQNQKPITIGLTQASALAFNLGPVLIAPKIDLTITLLDEFLKTAVRP